jgi:hypothetical protein
MPGGAWRIKFFLFSQTLSIFSNTAGSKANLWSACSTESGGSAWGRRGAGWAESNHKILSGSATVSGYGVKWVKVLMAKTLSHVQFPRPSRRTFQTF